MRCFLISLIKLNPCFVNWHKTNTCSWKRSCQLDAVLASCFRFILFFHKSVCVCTRMMWRHFTVLEGNNKTLFVRVKLRRFLICKHDYVNKKEPFPNYVLKIWNADISGLVMLFFLLFYYCLCFALAGELTVVKEIKHYKRTWLDYNIRCHKPEGVKTWMDAGQPAVYDSVAAGTWKWTSFKRSICLLL